MSITISQPSGCGGGGCTSSTPSINANPGTACSGDLISLTAGGCDNGTLTWQHNGATGGSTTANGPGTYVVKCKQGTCSETQNQVTVSNCNNQQNPGLWEAVGGSNRIRNTNGGPVVIGDGIANFPGNYKLYVADGIMTERLKVAIRNSGNWADFVFDPTYRLPDLRDVNRYVRQNGHLPGIPSASEVTQQGLDVAEMNARLLQKIEELTLYVIKQDADLRRLKKELRGLKNHKTH